MQDYPYFDHISRLLSTLIAILVFVPCSAQNRLWTTRAEALRGGFSLSLSADSSMAVSATSDSCIIYNLPGFTRKTAFKYSESNFGTALVCFISHDSEVAILHQNVLERYRVSDFSLVTSTTFKDYSGTYLGGKPSNYLRVDTAHGFFVVFNVWPEYFNSSWVIATILDPYSGSVKERIAGPNRSISSACGDNEYLCIPDDSTAKSFISFSVFQRDSIHKVVSSTRVISMASNGRLVAYYDVESRLVVFDLVLHKQLWSAVIPESNANEYYPIPEFSFVTDSLLLFKRGNLYAYSLHNGMQLWSYNTPVDHVLPMTRNGTCALLYWYSRIGEDCAMYQPVGYPSEDFCAVVLDIYTGRLQSHLPQDFVFPQCTDASFSRDESKVLITTTVGSYLCSAATGAVQTFFMATGKLSADSRTLLSLTNRELHVYDAQNALLQRTIELDSHANVRDFFMVNDGTNDLLVIDSSQLDTYNYTSGARTRRVQLDYGGSIVLSALSDRSRRVVCITSTLDILIVESNNTVQRKSLLHPADVVMFLKVYSISDDARYALLEYSIKNTRSGSVRSVPLTLLSIDEPTHQTFLPYRGSVCSAHCSYDNQYVYIDHNWDPIFHTNALSIVHVPSNVVSCTNIEYEARFAEGGFPDCSNRIISRSGQRSFTWMQCTTPMRMEQLCDSVKVDVEDHVGSLCQAFAYPNPARTTLTIQNPATCTSVFQIVDALGREYKSGSLEPLARQTFSIEDLPAGLYSVSMRSSCEHNQTSLIVLH